ncbi:hypothetical protein SR882_04930 [Guyparkeria halophila]|uniref:Cytochrome c domain-containing protein n=1 Tax=Guyparkeria halophila TaxID=47960 RepID=A0ABZ0YYJ3_9GAMM|nr:hypothetical protein [Guyparkeria halophila]WQH17249.1 hypothetical protein SR882_04930 [Guyparkeria halophila]
MSLSRPISVILLASLASLAGLSLAAHADDDVKGLSLKGVENHEALIPPQCYTRTDGRFNPCFTCHQSYQDTNRPNFMQDARLQAEYDFSDFAMTNRWSNLFTDRSDEVAAISDEEIRDYIAEDNYSALAGRLKSMGWEGFVPDLDDLQLADGAFDEHGFARDGSGWVAFNYKPLPSTFWPTNGSTDDVMLRLPEAFRQAEDCRGEGGYSVDAYRANLAILEAAIKDLPEIESLPVDENAICTDLNGDGERSVVTSLLRPDHYVGDASDVPVATMLYPEGIQFLHTVRYVGVTDDGEITHTPRMKEVRYMKKLAFHDREELREIYGGGDEHDDHGDEGRDGEDHDEEHGHEHEGDVIAGFADTGHGLKNEFGWLVLGFIEDKQGELRPQTKEEQLFCMGCHSTIGATLDQTFAFPRKVTGTEGWGYLDLKGMADAPNVGEIDGEILTYFERVGGGSEFRNNPEMQARWFTDEGEVDREKVEAADVHTLITPSPERALRLNKAYRVIVDEQSFIHGRDATVTPPENVYEEVDPSLSPLDEEYRYDWDIRLDWSRGQGGAGVASGT